MHDKGKSRIRYKKICPIHGEVTNAEIVSGFEYAKDQYAVVDRDEIEAFKSESDRSINVDRFVPRDSVDPLYFSGQAYYLIPDGKISNKPYALIRKTLADERLAGIGQVVISGKQRIARVWAGEKLLIADLLHYKTEITQADDLVDALSPATFSTEEANLAKTLLEGMSESDFSAGDYHDEYVERVRELIQAKIAGHEVAAPPDVQPPEVINLMAALKDSLKTVQSPQKVSGVRPPRPRAASKQTRGNKKGGGRRKSG